ncbi:MAG: glutamine-hydrolyzing carbamoyl-phosphate synthase small subunit [Candidatus Micrarchaeaceae archaeon]
MEDGTIIHGRGFGAESLHAGELVFTTSMNGYPESITDPSYKGQILAFSHPLVGNYGIPHLEKDRQGIIKNFESEAVNVEGVVINELSEGFKHNMKMDLSEMLARSEISGIVVPDTRSIVKRIREHGVIKAAIANGNFTATEARKAVGAFDYSKYEYVKYTTPKFIVKHGNGKYRIVVFDFGVKHGILRELEKYNTTLIRLPYSYSAEEALRLKPDGIVYSNGPGDPNKVYDEFGALEELKDSRIPTFGICLGHQLIAKAFGGKVRKMKYGHRAINKGVLDVKEARAIVTTHNHGYAVTEKPKNSELWFYSLDDNTIEGLLYNDLNIITTQFHPEGGPGTSDASYLFGVFMKMVKDWKIKQ